MGLINGGWGCHEEGIRDDGLRGRLVNQTEVNMARMDGNGKSLVLGPWPRVDRAGSGI